MKTFILVLFVGACLAATVQKPDFKRKRNEAALASKKHSPGKATRGIFSRLNPRNVGRENKDNDVDKRWYYYYYDYYNTNYNTDYYSYYDYYDYYDTDYYTDYSWFYYDYYNYYDDYYYGYWQGYWYGYYVGVSDGYDWGYVDGNVNGFDIGFSSGFYDAKYRYSYPYYKKRDVGRRSASPKKRSRTGHTSNEKRNAAMKTNDNTEKVQK